MLKKVLVVFLISFFSTVPAWSQLEVPPDIRWKTLKTLHFEIVFNAEQQDLGQLYAEKLELAYAKLRHFFPSLPKNTVVIINDKTDITNGYATRVPYPHIMAYPVLPGPQDALADTGDWAFELLAHEYTHILNFEPASGLLKPLRYIFGNIISANLLLPSWWKEGLAVDMETRLGSKGRLRSYFQDSTIRAMVLDNTFSSFDIAQANENIPTWPEGMRPYLFGSLMWSQMIADRGEGVVAQLNERYGGRAPFFINQPLVEIFQRDYVEQYQTMQADIRARTERQLAILRQVPFTQINIPQNSFASVTSPAISPDGMHMAVITESFSNTRSVRLLTRRSTAESFRIAPISDTIEKFDESFVPATNQDNPPSGSIQRISWFPDSQKIIYDKIDYTNRYQRFSDLFTYDLKSKKTEQLTHSLRAREPSISPSGEKIVFIHLDGSKTHVGMTTTKDADKNIARLYQGELLERLSYPIFWNEDSILVSSRKNGNDLLLKIDLQNKSIEPVLSDFKDIRFAKKTSQGLLFTSGQNGVLNLYLADMNLKNIRPITHTSTAFFSADLDSRLDEIFATTMTSNGQKIGAISAAEWKKTPAKLPVIEPLLADRYKNISDDSQDRDFARNSLANSELSDYSAASHLLPQYWIPFLSSSSSSSGIVFTAQTSGHDPLKKHSYGILGLWDTELNRGGLEISYMNQTTSLPFLGSVYQRNSYLGSVDNPVHDVGAALGVLPDMYWVSKYTSLQLGWQYMERETTLNTVKRTGPFSMLRHANYSQSGNQISPESGRGAYLGLYNYIEQEGYLNHSQILFGGEIYFSKFLPKNHAVMLKTNALYTPEKIPSVYGSSTESLVLYPDSPFSQYILRGYRRGQLLGRNLVTFNAEYRFPVYDIYRGSGTTPLFLRRLSGAVVVDGATADGLLFNEDTRSYEAFDMKQSLWSAGLEAKLDTNLLYVLPINFILGYYQAFNTPSGSEGSFGLTLQISGL